MFNTEQPVQKSDPSREIADAIDRNSTNAPALSVDEKASKISIVGDPNEIKPTKGDYKLTFVYPADELSDDDKAKMKQNADGDYTVTVEYKGKRVKPLYRSKVALNVAKIMVAMNVMNSEGYTTDQLTQNATLTLVEHIEEMGEIARMTLGISPEQVEYMQPEDLAGFFTQLMDNEPNILKESVGFLGLLLKGKEVSELMNEKPNTQQN